MDENEIIEAPVGGGLAQVAPQAAPAAAPAPATPQPSEYEKAMAAYQKQKQELLATQQRLIQSLESRVAGPSEMLFALSSAFGRPTRTGSFGESLGYATEALGQFQGQQRQQMSDIAKMRAEMAAQQLGLAKEDVDLARSQDLRKALDQMIGGGQQPGVAGAPAGAPAGGMAIPPSVAPILNVMKVMNPEAAIKYIADLAKDDAKRPDAIKAMETYLSMLPREMQDQAREYVARLNVFGKPSETVEARMKVYERLRAGQIDEKQAREELSKLEIPSISGAVPSGSVAPAPAPSAAPTVPPRVPAGAAPVSPGVTLSPQAREDIEKSRQTEEIKALANAREQAYKKLEEGLRGSESSASSAVTTINALERFLQSSPSAAAGGLQPFLTNVKNLLSSLGVSSDSLVNEQKMAAAIDQILIGKMESMGSAARGLTDKDMETLRNSLPRVNTDRTAREEIARIVIKSKANDIEEYRIQRVNESENFPEMARVRPAPRFYMDWIRKTEDFKQLRDQISRANTQQAKDDVMRRFDTYYGFGVARQLLR